MRIQALLLSAALLSGCATSPDVLCDHQGHALQVLASPPDEAATLISAIEESMPGAVDERRDRQAWLRDSAGNLYLCTYRKRPVQTGTCGATVHTFVRGGSGYAIGSTSISACH